MSGHEEFTVKVGGVGFVVPVTYQDSTDWDVDEIYPDVSEWPYKHGLYDLLSEGTRLDIFNEVDRELAEHINTVVKP